MRIEKDSENAWLIIGIRCRHIRKRSSRQVEGGSFLIVNLQFPRLLLTEFLLDQAPADTVERVGQNAFGASE